MGKEIERKNLYFENVLDKVSNTVCGAKWYNATIRLESGTTTSCHHPPFHQIDKKLLEKNPKALHNTKEKKEQRKKMLQGKRPEGCEYCWRLEDMGKDIVSDRYYKSKIYDNQSIIDLPKIGHKKDINLRTLEISFDNNCNFSCAYCGPQFSSTWEKDLNIHGPYKNLKDNQNIHYKIEMPYKNNDTINPYINAFWKWWPELKESLQELRITGGEPLLSQNFWTLTKKIEDTASNMAFAVNTNLGAPDSLINKLIKVSHNIDNFDLYTSCESVGPKAEYVRDGLNYKKFEENLTNVITKGNFRSIHIMMTVNALCIFELEKFLEVIYRWKKLKGILITYTLNILSFPKFMSYNVLPRDILNKRAKKISDWLSQNIDNPLMLFHEKESIIRLIKSMNSEKILSSIEVEVLEKDFKVFFEQYDKRRSKNIKSTFPQDFNDWYTSIEI